MGVSQPCSLAWGALDPRPPEPQPGAPALTRAVLPYEQPCTTPSVSGPHGGHVRGANRSDAEAGTEGLSSRAGHRGDPAAGHGQSRQRSPGGPSAGGGGWKGRAIGLRVGRAPRAPSPRLRGPVCRPSLPVGGREGNWGLGGHNGGRWSQGSSFPSRLALHLLSTHDTPDTTLGIGVHM